MLGGKYVFCTPDRLMSSDIHISYQKSRLFGKESPLSFLRLKGLVSLLSISDRLNFHHRMNLPRSIALKVGSPLDLTPISLRSYHFVLAAWGEKQAQSQSPL